MTALLHVLVAADTAGITLLMLGEIHDYRRTRRFEATVGRLRGDDGRPTVHHYRRAS